MKTKTQQVADGLRNNADGLGIGLPVVIAWAVQTYTGAHIPVEVAVALAGVLGSFGAKVKRAID